MAFTEDTMRDFMVSILAPRTERDAQVEVGASNLSNPCDRCRAYEIMGQERTDRMLEAAWGGRVVGTAIHNYIDANVKRAVETASEVGDDLAQLGHRYPGMQAERHMTLGELIAGRVITSSTDLWIPEECTIGDTKGTTMRKLAFIRDALAQLRGDATIFGRDHEFTVMYYVTEVGSGASKGDLVFRKLVAGVSEREYAKAISEALTKIERYSRQLNLYGFGLMNEGLTVKQAFINFVARDSAMTVDNRDSERYMDPASSRGVVSIGFTYNHAYATGIWKEAQAMAKALTDGAKVPTDYMSHPHCLVCASEEKHDAKLEATTAATADVDFAKLAAFDPWAQPVAPAADPFVVAVA